MSKKQLHALLVGINNYHPASVNVNNLGGSLTDVLRIDEYLRNTFSNHPEFEAVKPKMLIDDEATRDGVIKAFQATTSKLKAGDTFYFHYSGHGSREAAPPEFVEAFGEAKNETTVLYDSRIPGGMDLADKELAFLLSEIPKGVHTILTFDCCHAGSVTREIGELGNKVRSRQSSDATQQRSIDTYIGSYAERHAAGQSLDIPPSDHLMIAACRNTEKALEINDSGLFTQTLIKALESDNSDRSYAGIYSRINAIVKNSAKDQHPQFEYYGAVNPLANFLEGTVSSYPPTPEVNYSMGEWKMNFGAIDGLRQKEVSKMKLPIFVDGKPNEPIAHAEISNIGLQTSTLRMLGTSPANNPNISLRAGVAAFPLNVYLHNPDGEKTFRETVEKDKGSGILLVSGRNEAEYEVRIEQGGYHIHRIDPAQLLFGLEAQHKDAAEYMLDLLKKIAKWERMMTLENPITDLSKQSVALELYIDGQTEAYTEDLWVAEYGEDKRATPFNVKAKNGSNRHLYLNLLYLSPEMGITLVNKNTSQQTTAPGANADLFAAAAGIAQDSVDQIENHLMLVASTEPLENHFFSQSGIDPDDFGQIRPWSSNRSEGHRNLFATEPKADWTTRMITIKVIRPSAKVSQSRAVINQLEVEGHSGFEAKLSLLDVQTSTRSIGAAPPVHKAIADIPNASLLSLKGENHPPSTLEISGFDDASALKDNPLKIKIPAPKTEEEAIMPFTFDGEFFLPVGVPRSGDTEDGTQTFDIHHLPEEKQKTRSLGKALKLYFLKTALSKTVNQLRRVIYLKDGEIERTEEGLSEAIAGANKILLVVHGIIGDTAELAKSVKYTLDEGIYDLILTYDYENLSTSISVTGQKLKAKLVELGLDEKGIDIMAHSMGGLVSRWMIEKENGDRFVNRLVMLGTPNAGSPFSKLAPAIPALIALAANFQSPFLGPLVYLMHWMNDSRQINKTLGQMDADSDILNELNAADPPKTTYTIIGGNVSNYQGADSGSIASLLERITIGIGNLANWKKDNDIAVELASIFHLPEDERVKHIEVGSHHLIYFTHEDSVAELKQVL
ncbi:MAG: caspase family protein [Bacteroidota bacterium]